METEPLKEDPSQFYRTGWVFYLILAISGVLWVGFDQGDIPLSLFIDIDRWWQDLAIGLAAGSSLILLWALCSRYLASMRDVERKMSELIGPLDRGQIVSIALISGFSEELFFRGAMQSSWGWMWAVIIFAFLHTGPDKSFRIWTLFAIMAGGLFAWLTLQRGNILPSITAHALINGVNLHRLMRPTSNL